MMNSAHMLPGATLLDRVDHTCVAIELARKGGLAATRSKQALDFSNLSFGEFGLRVIVAAFVAAFLHAIRIVLVDRAKPKMRGIAARGIVPAWAVVADDHADGDRPVMQFPRYAIRAVRAVIEVNGPIPFSAHTPLPEPTFIRRAAFAIRPKRGLKRFVRMLGIHVAQNIAQRLTLNPTIFSVSLPCNRREFSTTALAVSVGDFICGILGLHRNPPFRCHAGNVYETLPGSSIADLHYSTDERIGVTP